MQLGGEADRLGDAIARLESATSKNADALRDLASPFKKLSLEGVAITEEAVALITTRLRNAAVESGLLDKVNGGIDKLVEIARAALGLNKDDESKTLNQMFDAFGSHIGASPSNMLAPDPALAAPGPPVFPGGF